VGRALHVQDFALHILSGLVVMLGAGDSVGIVFLFVLLPGSENPIEPNIAGFSDRFWIQVPFLDDPGRGTNRISDRSEECGGCALHRPYIVCVQLVPDVADPFHA
jgi:hypothetical protein